MRPLEGVKIVDLTHALAGPFCTFQLMRLGAEVIKIENPGGGDDFRGFMPSTFEAVNGGKASVVLNLKNRASLPVLDRLIADADVLVDNFKPGTAEKFGITWERVHAANPKLIWCSISGFGLDGPWRDLPAVEWSVQAASGMTSSYVADDAHPLDLGLGVLDLSTGHAAATAILAGLLQRAKTGEGFRIDVAMVDVALSLMTPRLGARGPGRSRRPSVGRFMAQDRRLFIMGPHDRWFRTISDVLGEPHLAEDERFATAAAREENADALRDAIEARLAAKPAEAWAKALTDAGVPASVVRRIDEVISSDHVLQRGVLGQATVAERGVEVPVLSPPYRIHGEGPPEPLTVPVLGADTERLLKAHGYSDGEVAELRSQGIV